MAKNRPVLPGDLAAFRRRLASGPEESGPEDSIRTNKPERPANSARAKCGSIPAYQSSWSFVSSLTRAVGITQKPVPSPTSPAHCNWLHKYVLGRARIQPGRPRPQLMRASRSSVLAQHDSVARMSTKPNQFLLMVAGYYFGQRVLFWASGLPEVNTQECSRYCSSSGSGCIVSRNKHILLSPNRHKRGALSGRMIDRSAWSGLGLSHVFQPEGTSDFDALVLWRICLLAGLVLCRHA